MHIGIVVQTLSKSFTGPSNYVRELAMALHAAGQRVTVITTTFDPKGAGLVEIPGADIRTFPLRGKMNQWSVRSPQLRDWLTKNAATFDILDLHGLWSFVIVDAARAARNANVPYILTPHGMMTRWDWRKHPWRKRIFFRALLKDKWRSAAAIRLLSEDEWGKCKVSPTVPVAIIPVSVSIPSELPLPDVALQFRSKHKIGESMKLIVFLGRITAQKGVAELVAAFDLLSRQLRDCALLLAGPSDGEYGRSVEASIARLAVRDRIHVLGPMYGQQKRELFSAASIFVTLSRSEGMPAAVLEAMTFGVPVVVTPDSNLPEIGEWHAGVITHPDPVAVSNVLVRVLTDDSLRSEMSRKAALLARERFSWEVTTPQIVTMYMNAAARKQRSGAVLAASSV